MPRTHALLILLSLALSAASALGSTLRPEQVLVVYDSRIADSLAVAEHYAGSASVPGGGGGEPGVRPGVNVFDLASIGVPLVQTNGTVTYEVFEGAIRDPIRLHLQRESLITQVRALVLTKGLPHRIDDPFNPGAGDNPTEWGSLWTAGQANAASVDSELTLLWENLPDIFVDVLRNIRIGYIRNPYWRQTRPINTYTNRFAFVDKAWDYLQGGRSWTSRSEDDRERFLPGDMILVCRLDGHSVADVRAMVERSRDPVYDVDASHFVIDESGSNGVADAGRNGEADNVADPLTREDDYETARDAVLSDGRFDPGLMHYNAASGQANFLVGPNVDFDGQGQVVDGNLILLTHFGRNHAGRPSTNIDRYEESFDLAPGAIFNTLESYNGRAFGGLGTRFQQGQVADFIAAGGTFGIGMVWEPFAQTLPDSTWLVRNFVLGGLTWAEAAYTAIPALSWMHVVVGDPLARARRSSDDINGDGVLDIDDLYAFERTPVDLNRDGAADDGDRRLLNSALRIPDQTTYDAGRR